MASSRTVDTPAPGALALGKPGTFTGREGPRVAWVGLEGDLLGLSRLATTVDLALERAGFPRESRPYRPHLTLARFPDTLPRPERLAIAERIAALQVARLVMHPESYTLFSSLLQRGGTIHSPLHHFPLEETAAAHDAVEQGAIGKVLLDIADA